MNISLLQDKASDLFFARNSDCDAETMAEVMRDFRMFEREIERLVSCGDLRAKIGLQLIATAGK